MIHRSTVLVGGLAMNVKRNIEIATVGLPTKPPSEIEKFLMWHEFVVNINFDFKKLAAEIRELQNLVTTLQTTIKELEIPKHDEEDDT